MTRRLEDLAQHVFRHTRIEATNIQSSLVRLGRCSSREGPPTAGRHDAARVVDTRHGRRDGGRDRVRILRDVQRRGGDVRAIALAVLGIVEAGGSSVRLRRRRQLSCRGRWSSLGHGDGLGQRQKVYESLGEDGEWRGVPSSCDKAGSNHEFAQSKTGGGNAGWPRRIQVAKRDLVRRKRKGSIVQPQLLRLFLSSLSRGLVENNVSGELWSYCSATIDARRGAPLSTTSTRLACRADEDAQCCGRWNSQSNAERRVSSLARRGDAGRR